MAKGEADEVVDAEQLAALRDRLLAEIGNIASVEAAAGWAQVALAAKNKLAVPDAKRVEDVFEWRLSELAEAGTEPASDALAIADSGPHETSTTASTDFDRSDGIDKSLLAVAAALPQPGAPSRCRQAAMPQSAVASHPTRITFATCSRARSAARRAMNSPCRSAVSIIARSIAPATNELGGRRSYRRAPSRTPVVSARLPAAEGWRLAGMGQAPRLRRSAIRLSTLAAGSIAHLPCWSLRGPGWPNTLSGDRWNRWLPQRSSVHERRVET
jgi:hypothetical protein